MSGARPAMLYAKHKVCLRLYVNYNIIWLFEYSGKELSSILWRGGAVGLTVMPQPFMTMTFIFFGGGVGMFDWPKLKVKLFKHPKKITLTQPNSLDDSSLDDSLDDYLDDSWNPFLMLIAPITILSNSKIF